MLILHCTKKALAQFKAEPAVDLPDSTDALGRWYCNLFIAERMKYLMLVDQETLFPLVVPARGLCAGNDLSWRLKQQIVHHLNLWQIPEQLFMPQLESFNEIVLTKTVSRSILGSMNDFVHHAKYLTQYYEMAPDSDEILYQLARTPMGAMKYASPIKMLKKVLGADNAE